MSYPDENATIGNVFGAQASLKYFTDGIKSLADQLGSDLPTETATVQGYAQTIFAAGPLPAGAYSLGGEHNDQVAVLRAPLPPVPVAIDPAQVTSSLALALIDIFDQLGATGIVQALTAASEQSAPLNPGSNPYPGT